ncbi:MAG: N-acetylmuramoyl-L-alanine amidase [Myxococcota bacterium]|nr:N-acetylmuramoyl-L-alanine amidase [Myxococcota bacterium]
MGGRQRRSIVVALVLGLALAGAGRAPAVGQPERFATVVLDAGHGGEDHGARGPGGLLEKKLVLDLVRRVQEKLEAADLRVVQTRTSDEFVPLERRTAIANDARADLFVSIHANAARARSARGVETYFLSLEASDEAARQVAQLENAAFGAAAARVARGDDPLASILGDLMASEQMHESAEFARLVQGELASLHPDTSRGVKQAPFVVLMGLQMPASLVEVGFITNSDEERRLRKNAHRDRVAGAIARAVLEFGRRYDARRGVAER